MTENFLEVKGLKAHLHTPHGIIKAVDGVSFDVRLGEVFGIAGESGSGKTLTALSILGLAPKGSIISGHALFKGTDLVRLDDESLRKIRGAKVSIVFQEPSSAFNPVFTIGSQVVESIMAHQRLTSGEAEDLALEFLKVVRIPDPDRIYRSYPHQLSGGTKQRVMIAMALVNSPELIILDEPTTALDVTIQAQILDLLKELIDRKKMSAIFISHDFAVLARMCGRVAVMYKGKIVEIQDTRAILNSPRDPYTISLIESVKALSVR